MTSLAWSEEQTPVLCGALSPDGVDTCAKAIAHPGWCSNGNLEWLDNAWNVSAYDQTQEAPPIPPEEPAKPAPPRPTQPAPTTQQPVKIFKLRTALATMSGVFFVGMILGHQIQDEPTVIKAEPVTTTATIERPAKATTITSVVTTTATSEVVRTEVQQAPPTAAPTQVFIGTPSPVPFTAVPRWCRVFRDVQGTYTGLCELIGHTDNTFFQSYDPVWRSFGFPWTASDGQTKYVRGSIFQYNAAEERWNNCRIFNCVGPLP